MFRRLCRSGFRIALAVLTFFFLLWWFGMRMPGRNISTAAPLSADETARRIAAFRTSDEGQDRLRAFLDR